MQPDNRNLKSHLQLLLLRHAKSSRDDSEAADIDRPLAPRGSRAAKAMGQTIARQGLVPDLVLCSPARRARQTWQLAAQELEHVPETKTIEPLYDFGDGSALLDVIRTHGGSAPSLMLVGHNPAMEELAKRLISKGPPKLRQRLETKFPTGALAIIRFRHASWAQLVENEGELTHFIRPADITTDTGE